MTRLQRLQAPLGFFVVALVLRALPAATVFADGQVFLRDGDAYYHLRRALYAVQNFPKMLTFDWYVQFPHGAKIIWPPLFDACLALLLWPVVKLSGLEAAERVAAWIPPLLGAATVVAAWSLARRYFGETAARWAGGLLCLLGGHVAYSRIGALDHHVAVSLLAVLLLGAAMRSVAAEPGREARQAALATGCLSGLALLVWPGSLLYAALGFAALAAAALTAPAAAPAASRWLDTALAALCTGVLVAPFSLGAEWPQWSSMSPVVLSNFQPWLFACVFGVAAATAFGLRTGRLPGGALARAAPPLGLGALLLGASVLASRDLAAGLGDALDWLAKREAFQASVIESQPLFVVRGRVSAHMAHLQLSPLVYAFPFVCAFALYEARRAARPAPRLVLLGFAVVLFALTLVQKRFLDAFTPIFAIQTAAVAASLWQRAGLQHSELGYRIAAVCAVAVLFPLHANFTPHADNLLRALQDEPLHRLSQQRISRVTHGLSVWLRARTPPTSGWLDDRVRPEYGVLAPWSAGHIIQHVGRRPAVVDNFGDDVGRENFAIATRFWQNPIDASDEVLEALGVRYVLVTRNPLSRSFKLNSVQRVLFSRDGSGIAGRRDPVGARAAGRYRLVRESSKLTALSIGPYAKIFELVPGARIRGRTRPGQRLGLALRVETNRERSFLYRDRLDAEEDGSFTFVVPYANSGGPEGIGVAASYKLFCGFGTKAVVVSEREVLGGESLWVADPCSPD